MTLPGIHLTGDYPHETCTLGLDNIQIRDYGRTVALCCAKGHMIVRYNTENLKQAEIQADELSRIYKVRVLER